MKKTESNSEIFNQILSTMGEGRTRLSNNSSLVPSSGRYTGGVGNGQDLQGRSEILAEWADAEAALLEGHEPREIREATGDLKKSLKAQGYSPEQNEDSIRKLDEERAAIQEESQEANEQTGQAKNGKKERASDRGGSEGRGTDYGATGRGRVRGDAGKEEEKSRKKSENKQGPIPRSAEQLGKKPKIFTDEEADEAKKDT